MYTSEKIWFKVNKNLITEISNQWEILLGFKTEKSQYILQQEFNKTKSSVSKSKAEILLLGMKFNLLTQGGNNNLEYWESSTEEYIKQLEYKLKDQRIFFDSIFFNIITDIVIFDTSHRYLYVNSKAIENDITREWIIGKTDLEYCAYKNISSKVAEKRINTFKKVIQSKQGKEFIDEHQDKSGAEVFIHRKMYPIIKNDKIEYVLGIGYDITDIKFLENKLTLSKREYKKLFNENVAGIFLKKPNGDMVRWNKALINIFGYEEAEFQSLNATALYQDEKFRIKYIKDLRKNNGKLINYELLTMHKNGDKLFLNANISLITIEKEEFIHGTIFDNTEKKKIENKIIKINTELQQKNDDLLDYNYMISHNLRSPLSNITGLISLLNIDNSSTDKYNNEVIEKIKLSAIRLDETVHDLNSILNMRKHEKAIREDVSVRNLLNNVLKEFTPQLKNIKVNIIQKGKVKLVTNKIYFINMLHNLISNAIKYKSNEHDPIIDIYILNKDTEIELSVKDNGIGIDLNKHKEIIFKAFKQIDKAKEGKGLGLSLIKTQVRSLGGSIKVESKEKEGTIFTIKLPHFFND